MEEQASSCDLLRTSVLLQLFSYWRRSSFLLGEMLVAKLQEGVLSDFGNHIVSWKTGFLQTSETLNAERRNNATRIRAKEPLRFGFRIDFVIQILLVRLQEVVSHCKRLVFT